ncbi:amidase signature enzyme [Ceraceosorus bombacis]|uniref:Glutamyl-tRNA(Gln) amidotransferase subunit A, mitochondrial n=1 Tax=Ceraceosorus bombacis TaxID=401625 RepID=A0A0P1BRV9_9BASI|nr:amidase signature enzyme [Ceraceosorus bombacis]
MPTSCSSRMLHDYTSPFDATAVCLLRQAGAQLIGKTNCDEFGMGSHNVHTVYGPVLNPASPDAYTMGNKSEGRQRHRAYHQPRVAGGSSGGAAASVRAGLARIALASDTGGSIRIPASHCGVWGLKPSYGLISRWGLVSYADSLDTLGLLGRTPHDLQSAFEVLNMRDEKDPSAVPDQARKAAREAARSRIASFPEGSLEGLRIGIPVEYFPSELEPQIIPPLHGVLRNLKQRGAVLRSISLSCVKPALGAYYVVASAEASSNLARYDGVRYGHQSTDKSGISEGQVHPYAHTRSEAFGEEVKRRILLGTHALTSSAFDNYFLQAQRVRLLVQRGFENAFRDVNVLLAAESSEESHKQTRPMQRSAGEGEEEGVDLIVGPASTSAAPTLASVLHPSGQKSSASRTSAYVQDVLTVPASLAGLPSLCAPAGVAQDGWPVGICLTAQWGHEETIWRVAKEIEMG